MKRARNTEGLKLSAVARRASALARAEEALAQLVHEKAKNINISSVAERAQVSRTWLYGETDLVARIQHLRAQQSTHFDLPPKNERPSNASHNAIVSALKKRIHNLMAENKELRRELEVLGGLVYSAHEKHC